MSWQLLSRIYRALGNDLAVRSRHSTRVCHVRSSALAPDRTPDTYRSEHASIAHVCSRECTRTVL